MIFTKFPSLPQEIQDQIWVSTLPRPRIFDVDLDESDIPSYSWSLRNVNPLPIALQICYDSRAAALRQGFFFEYSPNKTFFFIPQTDILYFGLKGVRFLLRHEPISMPGLDRVLNFGFGPFYLPSLFPKELFLRVVVKCLYIQMPHLKTLNYTSPVPDSRASCEYALSPLPGDVEVKLDGTETDATYEPWADWKVSIMKALERCEHRPEICGWKLTSELTGPQGLSLLSDTS